MTESLYNGYKRIDFTFEGMNATIVFPNEPNSDKNWLLKTEYFEAFPNFELEMLSRGWHVAYVANVTRWCLDEDIDRKKRFCDFMTAEYELHSKCIPVGLSCGGMIGCKFAAKYPECVSALYLDAPVMNLLSCPAGLGKAQNFMMPEFVEAFGMTLAELISYRNHPIDNIPSLFEHNIPVIMLYGDVDDIVPYDENGAILEKYYRERGGNIVTIARKGCGHHPHGLDDLTPLVEFAEKYR